MSFKDRLKEQRERIGMSRVELAEILNVTQAAISNYENGVSVPKSDVLFKVFNALKCDANYLFQDEMKSANQPTVLNAEEARLLERYNNLDVFGKHLIDTVLEAEEERLEATLEAAKKTDKGTLVHRQETYRTSRKYPANVVVLEDYSDAPEDTTTIPVYDAGASAGTGIFLDSDYYDVIAIADNYTNRKANFAVWVDGHSMEPRFNDGDLVLVRQQPQVDIGEIGIFIVNGEGFIKKLGEGELISLNPDYENIPLNEWDDICCKGRVLGKL